MWLAYVAYWLAMATDVKSDALREEAGSRLQRLILMILAILLLGVPKLRLSVLDRRFLPTSVWWVWIGAAVTASGLLFSVWGPEQLCGVSRRVGTFAAGLLP